MNLTWNQIVLYGEWLTRRDANTLLYNNTCICHASKARCAGHITYRDSYDGEEQLWPERQTKRMDEKTIELTLSYGRQPVKHTRTRYVWWDVEQQVAYGPDFETRELADQFRVWIGDRDPRVLDQDAIEAIYAIFLAGFPALPPVACGGSCPVHGQGKFDAKCEKEN